MIEFTPCEEHCDCEVPKRLPPVKLHGVDLFYDWPEDQEPLGLGVHVLEVNDFDRTVRLVATHPNGWRPE
jgi:hypothetical protein